MENKTNVKLSDSDMRWRVVRQSGPLAQDLTAFKSRPFLISIENITSH